MRASCFPAVLLIAAVAPAPSPGAEPFPAAAWQFRQEVAVTQPGPVRIALPVGTLDAARADLADLRLADPAGAEVAFALERATPASSRRCAPQSLEESVEDNATVFVLTTGTGDLIVGMEIDAGEQSFLTRALVESSDDGQTWRLLGRNLPLYDRGARLRALHLNLPPGSYPRLRLTLDRLGGRHVALRDISLITVPAHAETFEPVAVRIVSRDETPGETRLTLALPGANLHLGSLEVTTPEPVFKRPVRLFRRSFEDEAVREVTIAEREISRVNPSGNPGTSFLAIPIEQVVPARELVLVVDNGDSPPLALPGVVARRRLIFAVFYAATAGPHTLYAGNPKAVAPRYDVGSLTGMPDSLCLAPGPLGPNPEFQPPESLPEIPALGAPLDVDPWSWRRAVHIGATGVQQLELDPAVLARAQGELGDLRLVSDGLQVPYVIERTSRTRSLAAKAALVPDPKRPSFTRWRLSLPQPRLPLIRLTARVSAPLFQRTLHLYEDLEDDRGYVSRRWLGDATWSRTPAQGGTTFTLNLGHAPETATLWLETDNGDNPAITLDDVSVCHRVTRLLFKATNGKPVYLYYGSAGAAAPHYDLSLVGGQLLAAEKVLPELGPEEALKTASLADTIATAGRGGILFWGMLGLVVIVLLVVVARLLPKAPAAKG